MYATFKSEGPLAYAEVNINEASEVRHWTQHWEVTEADLRRAVAEVGTSVDELRVALGK